MSKINNNNYNKISLPNNSKFETDSVKNSVKASPSQRNRIISAMSGLLSTILTILSSNRPAQNPTQTSNHENTTRQISLSSNDSDNTVSNSQEQSQTSVGGLKNLIINPPVVSEEAGELYLNEVKEKESDIEQLIKDRANAAEEPALDVKVKDELEFENGKKATYGEKLIEDARDSVSNNQIFYKGINYGTAEEYSKMQNNFFNKENSGYPQKKDSKQNPNGGTRLV